MNIKLPESIKTHAEAFSYMLDLHNNGYMYHPDDDPHDMIWDNRIVPPTPEECDKMNILMGQINEVKVDPGDIACNLIDQTYFKQTLSDCLKYFPAFVADTELTKDIKFCLERLEHIIFPQI